MADEWSISKEIRYVEIVILATSAAADIFQPDLTDLVKATSAAWMIMIK
jgi:hypothetical protein